MSQYPLRQITVTDEQSKRFNAILPRRKQIHAVIKEFPGVTSAQTAEILGCTSSETSALLSHMIKDREVHRFVCTDKPQKGVVPFVYFDGPNSKGVPMKRRAARGAGSSAQSSAASAREPEPRAAAEPAREDDVASKLVVINNKYIESHARPGETWGAARDRLIQEHGVHAIISPSVEHPPVPQRVMRPSVAPMVAMTGELEVVADRFADSIADDIADLFARSIAGRLADKIKAKTAVKVSEQLEQMMSTDMDSLMRSSAERVALKSMLIIGLLPDQANLIEEEFGECFRLKFWKDGGTKNLRDIAKQSDYVLTFTSKMSHSHTEALDAVGAKPIRIDGGMTSLRKRMTELYVNAS